MDGRIFVFGGEDNEQSETGVFSQIEAYEPVADVWTEYEPMLLPRHGFGAVTIGSRIYLPGAGNVQGFGSVDEFTAFYLESTTE